MSDSKLDSEIRFIEPSKLVGLSSIIDRGRGWDTLLEAVTKPMDNLRIQPLKLSLDNIELMKQQFYHKESPTLALLNYWSITGRRRPTVRTLLYYLRYCNLRRAEDYVRETILGQKPIPPRPLQHPPQLAVELGHHHDQTNKKAAIGDTPDEVDRFTIDEEFRFDALDEIINNLEGDLRRYSFSSIYTSTNRFCHKPYDSRTKTGTRIGDGRFSSVFLAQTFEEETKGNNKPERQQVAAKLLKYECNRKYLANEINLAQKIKHENILELLGIALGGASGTTTAMGKELHYICLIYPYIQNGSLLSCLSFGLPCRNLEQLDCDRRLNIAVKVARGIAYLHTFHEGPIVHRDIKTANILIDVDLEPKVGDFTLVRQLDSSRQQNTQFSQNVIGTSVYMPPEAFRGDISTKFDTFSFGIVIFELLTGLKPFNDDLDEDLYTYISEKLSDIHDQLIQEHINTAGGDINTGGNNSNGNELNERTKDHLLASARDRLLLDQLDRRAGDWNFEVARVMFQLALRATADRKKDRPEMGEILPVLEDILLKHLGAQ